MITTNPTSLVPASFLACASCLLPERTRPVRPVFRLSTSRWDLPVRPDGVEGALRSPLTPAEKRVLGLMLMGLADKEIACELGRALPTVKHQVGAVLRKHGVPSRARLMAVLHEAASGLPEPILFRQAGGL